jgi:hypothetical protein
MGTRLGLYNPSFKECPPEQIDSLLRFPALIQNVVSFLRVDESMHVKRSFGIYSTNDSLVVDAFRFADEDFVLYLLPPTAKATGTYLLLHGQGDVIRDMSILSQQFERRGSLDLDRDPEVRFQEINGHPTLMVSEASRGTGIRAQYITLYRIDGRDFIQTFSSFLFNAEGTSDTSVLDAHWQYLVDFDGDGFLDIREDIARTTINTAIDPIKYSRIWVQWTVERARPDSSYFLKPSVFRWDPNRVTFAEATDT